MAGVALAEPVPVVGNPERGPLVTAAGLAVARMPSPVGELVLVAGPSGLRAVLWQGEDGSRVPRALATPVAPTAEVGAQEVLEQTRTELAEYFQGSRQRFEVPLDLIGTGFQRQAWQALREIGYASAISYGQQAAALGRPGAARAVGAANAANPISIIIPCHRVVAASGALTGFAGGLGCKQWLLDHERRVVSHV